MAEDSKIGIGAVAVVFLLLLGGAVWWKVYAYKECKKVGHSTFYCIMRVGEN